MKRIQLFSALLASTFLAGCVDLYNHPNGYYDYDYYNKYGHHFDPNATSAPMTQMNISGKPHGRKPRPYSVTPQDQAKYDSLNNRIKGQAKQVKGATTSDTTVASDKTTTTATTSDPNATKDGTTAKMDSTPGTSTNSTSSDNKASANITKKDGS